MNMSQSLLSFCLMNARFVRNKTAMLMDYICDLKADLYAMTETWLTENDASVRVELIPDGYNLLDQPRVGRGGGGTGLLYRNDLRVKKVESAEKNSFEFSEWIISSIGHDIRLFIIYRPPYSDEHQVPTSVFFTEFSEYLESAVLSKENLLISGDFNIRVDNIHDSDATKFSDLSGIFRSQTTCDWTYAQRWPHLRSNLKRDALIVSYLRHLKLIAIYLTMHLYVASWPRKDPIC